MDDRWTEHLTGTMREIADSIGMTATFLLWRKFKYQTIWIAEDWRRNQQLIELLGEEAARKISTDFGAEEIYVAGDAIEDFLLAIRALELDREGISTVQISKRIGITRTRVYLLRKKFASCREWLSESTEHATF